MDADRNQFAVLLNDNAKRVSDKIKTKIDEVAPNASLFYTKTKEEALAAMEDIVKNRIPTLFCGGGDGTLVNMFSNLKQAMEKMKASGFDDFQMPKIAPLKLGTGNAVAGYMGIRKGLEPLWNYIKEGKEAMTRFNLIESDDKVFHFAGLGWDAAVLNDYYTFKNKFSFGPMKHWMNNITGYLTSMVLKTIPEQFFRRDRPSLKVIAKGPVYEVSKKSPPVLIEPEGGVIYEGPCNVAGVSTVPEYGYRMKAFPFARDKDGYMNLRIVRAGIIEVLTNWMSIYRGKWQSRNMKDYLAQRIEMVFDRPMPYHVGGDAMGLAERVDFSVSDFSVDVIDAKPVV